MGIQLEADAGTTSSRGCAKGQRIFVLVLLAILFLTSGFITFVMWHQPHRRAMLFMAWGLIWLWIIGCGLAMCRWRDSLCHMAAKVPLSWPVKFVAGCILLAMLEEAVTTSMTNCAPLFGVKVGQAYITASANYFDVIFRHSVVVFVPMFIGWAVLLKYWRFSPFEVFVLWGITGTFLEFSYSGYQGVPNFPFWILVYGPMVWLPAHFPAPARPARPPKWWAYPLAVILPPLFLPLDVVLAPWLWLGGKHPDIHFPPISG
ncbi:MAG TPA: hypothetical protein VFE51_26485 [Verrucomicrobiae bacterium]|nr:hypothetical protein [Verrucomicrobiae bacterium]